MLLADISGKEGQEENHAERQGWVGKIHGCYGGCQERSVPEDGQPYCTLQRPELGNHVRETVLLKIQNSRVFIKPASLKAGIGEGHREPPLLPERKEEGIIPESWKKGN